MGMGASGVFELSKAVWKPVMLVAGVPLLYLVACQSKMIYWPRGYGAAQLEGARAAGVVRVPFRTGQGDQVAYYVPPQESPARRVWYVFGGNGSLALDWLDLVEPWSERDGFLLVDYPGYGECEGKPRPARVRDSAAAAIEALRSGRPELEGVDAAVLGHSLGCAAALMAAREAGATRAVLVAPFTSMAEMANEAFFWPLGWITHHRYDNVRELEAWLAEVPGARAVLFHGAADGVIPPAMSENLAGLHPGRVTRTEVAGAGHNDVLDLAHDRIGAAVLDP